MAKDEKIHSAHEIIIAVVKCNAATNPEEYDDSLKQFISALDYYLERQSQAWIK